MNDVPNNAAPPGASVSASPTSPPGTLMPDGAAPQTLDPGISTILANPDGGWPLGLADLPERLSAFVDAGGPVVLVLGVLSVVALAIVLLKVWQFAWLRLGALGPVEEALRHWRHHEPQAAIAAVTAHRQPVARLLHVALTGLQRPQVDQATLREELTRVASAELERLRGYLRALEVIGTMSPLLGLLGTVLGMIEAFKRLETAGANVDPAILSGGIWQALLTTAVGLSIAIPVVLAHTWLERRVERCGHRMEDAVTQVFTRDLGAAPAKAGPHHQGTASLASVEVGHAA
jgi:biopolymer transport protein ExbB